MRGDTLKLSVCRSHWGEPTCLPPPWNLGLIVRLLIVFLPQLVGFFRTWAAKVGCIASRVGYMSVQCKQSPIESWVWLAPWRETSLLWKEHIEWELDWTYNLQFSNLAWVEQQYAGDKLLLRCWKRSTMGAIQWKVSEVQHPRDANDGSKAIRLIEYESQPFLISKAAGFTCNIEVIYFSGLRPRAL